VGDPQKRESLDLSQSKGARAPVTLPPQPPFSCPYVCPFVDNSLPRLSASSVDPLFRGSPAPRLIRRPKALSLSKGCAHLPSRLNCPSTCATSNHTDTWFP